MKAQIVSKKTARTEELDNLVLETIKQNPGITAKQLEIILADNPKGEFSQSFLTNSLRRLENIDNAIYKLSKKEFEHGKIVRTYWAKESADFDYDLQFEKNVLKENIDYTEKKEISAFAIGKKTIAIANSDNKHYLGISKFSSPFEIYKDNDFVKLKFPNEFVDFYNLKPNEFSFQFLPPDENKGIRIEIIENVESSGDFYPQSKKKILVFEDIEDYCESLVSNLQEEGHDVDYAHDVEGFKNKLRNKKPFDFIVLDKRIKTESEDENVAGKLYFEIKKEDPGAEVGLLTKTKLSRSEKDYYTKLGFKTILYKREYKIGEQLLKVLRAR